MTERDGYCYDCIAINKEYLKMIEEKAKKWDEYQTHGEKTYLISLEEKTKKYDEVKKILDED